MANHPIPTFLEWTTQTFLLEKNIFFKNSDIKCINIKNYY